MQQTPTALGPDERTSTQARQPFRVRVKTGRAFASQEPRQIHRGSRGAGPQQRQDRAKRIERITTAARSIERMGGLGCRNARRLTNGLTACDPSATTRTKAHKSAQFGRPTRSLKDSGRALCARLAATAVTVWTFRA